MANSVDPDQTAPIGAVCSGSTLFVSILNSSVMLGNYLQQTTSADDIFRCDFFLGALRVNIVDQDLNQYKIVVLLFVAAYANFLKVLSSVSQSSISENHREQGSYKQECVKFKDFSGTTQRLFFTVFKD